MDIKLQLESRPYSTGQTNGVGTCRTAKLRSQKQYIHLLQVCIKILDIAQQYPLIQRHAVNLASHAIFVHLCFTTIQHSVADMLIAKAKLRSQKQMIISYIILDQNPGCCPTISLEPKTPSELSFTWYVCRICSTKSLFA